MTESSLLIRPFKEGDEKALVSLWNMCKLTVPWNNPYKDIARKLKVQAELFLVGYLEDKLIATVMAGYDGHRGWINYFAVHPDFQSRGATGSSSWIMLKTDFVNWVVQKSICRFEKGKIRFSYIIKNLALLRKSVSTWVKGLKTISDFNPIQLYKTFIFF